MTRAFILIVGMLPVSLSTSYALGAFIMSTSWTDWHRFPLAAALIGAAVLRTANLDSIISDVALLLLEACVAFFLYLWLYKNDSGVQHRWKAAFVAVWAIVIVLGFVIRVSDL